MATWQSGIALGCLSSRPGFDSGLGFRLSAFGFRLSAFGDLVTAVHAHARQ